jgi:hypothetical protein
MHRAYLSIQAADVPSSSDSHLFGLLAQKLPFAIEPTQGAAWQYQIRHLRELAVGLPGAHFFMEFLIPRMGRRTDLIVIVRSVIFVVEYKVGAHQFDRSGLEQVYGYGLDLKYFHETSQDRQIVPVLVATEAPKLDIQSPSWDQDGLARPLKASSSQLASTINRIAASSDAPALDGSVRVRAVLRGRPRLVFGIDSPPAGGTGDAVCEVRLVGRFGAA